jgi:hypothetical protein
VAEIERRCATIGASLIAKADPASPITAAWVPPPPEESVRGYVELLRTVDPVAGFDLLSEDDRLIFTGKWEAAKQEIAQHRDLVDALLALPPDQVAKVLLPIQLARLKTFDAQAAHDRILEVADHLDEEWGADSTSPTASADRQAATAQVRALLVDLARWITEAGIEDPATVERAIADLAGALAATRIADADALRALSLPELIVRVGPLVESAKRVMKLYHLDAEAFLASVSATSEGSDSLRTMRVRFTAFGHQYESVLRLRRTLDQWVAEDEDSAQDLLMRVMRRHLVPGSMLGSSSFP